MDLKKILKIAYYAIVVTLLIIALYQILWGDEQVGSSFGVWQGLVFVVIAVIASLVLALIGLINKPKSAIWFLAGLGVLGILYAVGKGLATNTVPLAFADDGITLATVQNSEAGVWISLILGGIAVVLAVASGVKSMTD